VTGILACIAVAYVILIVFMLQFFSHLKKMDKGIRKAFDNEYANDARRNQEGLPEQLVMGDEGG
jgi:hypothetical protein